MVFNFYKTKKHKLSFLEMGDRRLVIDIDGGVYVGDSFLVLEEAEQKKLKIGDIREIRNLELFYQTYIEDKKNFLKEISKNPYLKKFNNHPTILIINSVLDYFDRKLKKDVSFYNECKVGKTIR